MSVSLFSGYVVDTYGATSILVCLLRECTTLACNLCVVCAYLRVTIITGILFEMRFSLSLY